MLGRLGGGEREEGWEIETLNGSPGNDRREIAILQTDPRRNGAGSSISIKLPSAVPTSKGIKATRADSEARRGPFSGWKMY